jgi:hypothetical protein
MPNHDIKVRNQTITWCLPPGQVGQDRGGAQRGWKESWVRREEERMEEEERRAYWQAFVQGIGRRRGRFVG